MSGPPKAAEAHDHLARLGTGVTRLDELLQGGLPPGSTALLYGPAFLGKEMLARKAALATVGRGLPAILVLTNTSAEQAWHDLERLDPKVEDAADQDLLHFVDMYSASIGAPENVPHTHYLDGTMDLNALSVAVNRIQRELVPLHEQHLIVLDSLSTIIAQGSAQTAFRFLQVFIGRTRLVGANHLLLMDEGMHSDAELQMFKHLASGMLHLRDNQGKAQMQVQGMGVTSGQSWVDYRFDDTRFEVTGSFAQGRIR